MVRETQQSFQMFVTLNDLEEKNDRYFTEIRILKANYVTSAEGRPIQSAMDVARII